LNDSGAASLARTSRGIAAYKQAVPLGHLWGTASAWVTPFLECPYDHRHPSQKTFRCRGQTFPTGDLKVFRIRGRAGYVSCTVRSRGDNGAGVCRPLIQIYKLHPIPHDFEHLNKRISKTKCTVPHSALPKLSHAPHTAQCFNTTLNFRVYIAVRSRSA
jgi:hypothetical protein